MDAGAIVTVSATVVALTQLAKWAGVSDSKGPLAVLILSVLGVAFWGWSVGDILERTKAFGYLAGLVAVMTGAAGIFGFTRASGEGLAKMTNSSGPKVLGMFTALLAMVLVSGCSGLKQLPKLPAEVPAVVETAGQDFKAASVKALQIMDPLGDIVNDGSKIRADLEADGIGSKAIHDALSASIIKISNASLAAIETIRRGTSSWDELKALIDPILQSINPLIETITTIGGSVKDRLFEFGKKLADIGLQLVGLFWQPGVAR